MKKSVMKRVIIGLLLVTQFVPFSAIAAAKRSPKAVAATKLRLQGALDTVREFEGLAKYKAYKKFMGTLGGSRAKLTKRFPKWMKEIDDEWAGLQKEFGDVKVKARVSTPAAAQEQPAASAAPAQPAVSVEAYVSGIIKNANAIKKDAEIFGNIGMTYAKARDFWESHTSRSQKVLEAIVAAHQQFGATLSEQIQAIPSLDESLPELEKYLGVSGKEEVVDAMTKEFSYWSLMYFLDNNITPASQDAQRPAFEYAQDLFTVAFNSHASAAMEKEVGRLRVQLDVAIDRDKFVALAAEKGVTAGADFVQDIQLMKEHIDEIATPERADEARRLLAEFTQLNESYQRMSEHLQVSRSNLAGQGFQVASEEEVFRESYETLAPETGKKKLFKRTMFALLAGAVVGGGGWTAYKAKKLKDDGEVATWAAAFKKAGGQTLTQVKEGPLKGLKKIKDLFDGAGIGSPLRKLARRVPGMKGYVASPDAPLGDEGVAGDGGDGDGGGEA